MSDSFSVVSYTPTFFLTPQELRQWLRDVLFPLIDSLGQESIKNVRVFWSQAKLSLPAPYAFAETACTKDFLSDNYHVVYQGHHVGITAVQSHSDDSVKGVSNAKRLKVRSMQKAHVVWWRWLRLLAKLHLDRPELAPKDVVLLALPRAPTTATRNSVKPLYSELPPNVVSSTNSISYD